MTHSENENDHFDLDHFDHNLPHPSSSHITLMLLLFEMGVIWDLHRNCLCFATKAFLVVYLALALDSLPPL